ncbi:MAG TPA: phosphoribosyltransferase family protein [Burkholderiales bacterium]|nr:phosphoribosyltransferase family protein [Burkholderiales bacterium]
MQGVHDIPALRDRAPVFRDRAHAGVVLAGLLEALRGGDAIVLAIPSGGVPVAAEVAKRLAAPLEVAVVSKILLPWTTEAGYGAIAWDGSLWMNEEEARYYRLTEDQIAASVAEARAKVRRRCALLRGSRPMPALAGRTAILVDDGIAAGSTMRAAIGALRGLGAGRILVAAPTGHERSVRALAELADALCCANLRGGPRFAVADAYERWCDVTEEEAAEILARFTATMQ